MSSEKKFRIQNGLDVAGEVLVNGINIVGADGVLNQASYQTAVQAMIDATVAQGVDQNSIDSAVSTAVAALADSAPETLNTLNELAAALGDDADFATSMTNALNTKLNAANNLSDVADAAAARSNLGLGTAATAATTSFATAAQGTKADNAATQADLDTLQATINAGVATFNQGALADTAVQPGDLGALALMDKGTGFTTTTTNDYSWSSISASNNDWMMPELRTLFSNGDISTSTNQVKKDSSDNFSASSNMAFYFNNGTAGSFGTKHNWQNKNGAVMLFNSNGEMIDLVVSRTSNAQLSGEFGKHVSVTNNKLAVYEGGGYEKPSQVNLYDLDSSTGATFDKIITTTDGYNGTSDVGDILLTDNYLFVGVHYAYVVGQYQSTQAQGHVEVFDINTGSKIRRVEGFGQKRNFGNMINEDPDTGKIYVIETTNANYPNYSPKMHVYNSDMSVKETDFDLDISMSTHSFNDGNRYKIYNGKFYAYGSDRDEANGSYEGIQVYDLSTNTLETRLWSPARTQSTNWGHTFQIDPNTGVLAVEEYNGYSTGSHAVGNYVYYGRTYHFYDLSDLSLIGTINAADVMNQGLVHNQNLNNPGSDPQLNPYIGPDYIGSAILTSAGLLMYGSYWNTYTNSTGEGNPLQFNSQLVSTTSLNVDQTVIDSAVAGVDLSAYATTAEMNTAIAGVDVTGSDLDMGGNKVLFGNMYSTLADLPSATTYHGMFAHVHATGKGYFAHAGNWVELANTSDLLTQSDIDTAVANLVDSAPDALNTLNELAAALGDDANFASTVTTSLAAKADDATVTAALATKADVGSYATLAQGALADTAVQPGALGTLATMDKGTGFTETTTNSYSWATQTLVSALPDMTTDFQGLVQFIADNPWSSGNAGYYFSFPSGGNRHAVSSTNYSALGLAGLQVTQRQADGNLFKYMGSYGIPTVSFAANDASLLSGHTGAVMLFNADGQMIEVLWNELNEMSSYGKAVNISPDETKLAVFSGTSNNTKVSIYDLSSTGATLSNTFNTGSSSDANDGNVAMSNNHIFIGQPTVGGGSIKVYDYSGNLVRTLTDGGSNGSYLGSAVHYHNDMIVSMASDAGQYPNLSPYVQVWNSDGTSLLYTHALPGGGTAEYMVGYGTMQTAVHDGHIYVVRQPQSGYGDYWYKLLKVNIITGAVTELNSQNRTKKTWWGNKLIMDAVSGTIGVYELDPDNIGEWGTENYIWRGRTIHFYDTSDLSFLGSASGDNTDGLITNQSGNYDYFESNYFGTSVMTNSGLIVFDDIGSYGLQVHKMASGLQSSITLNVDQTVIDSAVAGVDLSAYTTTADLTSSDLDLNGNKVLFGNVYSNLADLPDASTYHGMFAHVHATGKGYFAHAGNWVELANTSDLLTQSDIDTAIANLVDTAPDALNTLNELAAALGDDANFASTVTASLATKADDAATTAALATKATSAQGALADTAVQPEDLTTGFDTNTVTTTDWSVAIPDGYNSAVDRMVIDAASIGRNSISDANMMRTNGSTHFSIFANGNDGSGTSGILQVFKKDMTKAWEVEVGDTTPYMVMSDTYAGWVNTGTDTAYVYNLSDGSLVNSFSVTSPNFYVATGIYGTKFLSGYRNQLYVYDITTGNLDATIALPGSATGAISDTQLTRIEVVGDKAYINDWNYDVESFPVGSNKAKGAIYVIDLTTNTLAATITNPSGDYTRMGGNFAVGDGYLVVTRYADSTYQNDAFGRMELFSTTYPYSHLGTNNVRPGTAEPTMETQLQIADGILFQSSPTYGNRDIEAFNLTGSGFSHLQTLASTNGNVNNELAVLDEVLVMLPQKVGTQYTVSTITSPNATSVTSFSVDDSLFATKAYVDSGIATGVGGVDLSAYTTTADLTSNDLDLNGNKVLFGNVYSTLADLPSATTYHGMFAHVHATGKGYFAHAGNWVELANSSDLLTQSDIDTAVSTAVDGLVDSAPGTLDTLNELAAALGDDANFASTVTTSLAAKADSSALDAAVADIATKADSSAVATAAQGALADTALQPSDLGTGFASSTSTNSDLSSSFGTLTATHNYNDIDNNGGPMPMVTAAYHGAWSGWKNTYGGSYDLALVSNDVFGNGETGAFGSDQSTVKVLNMRFHTELSDTISVGVTMSGPNGSAFGQSVAFNDNYIVVGAPRQSDGGAIHIFTPDANMFVGPVDNVITGNTALGLTNAERFGSFVVMVPGADEVIVSAPRTRELANQNYWGGRVVHMNLSDGSVIKEFIVPNPRYGMQLGDGNYGGMVVKGDNLFVCEPGIPGGDNKVHQFSISTGNHIRALVAADGGGMTRFGSAMAVVGDYLVVGEQTENEDLYVFDMDGNVTSSIIVASPSHSGWTGARTLNDTTVAIREYTNGLFAPGPLHVFNVNSSGIISLSFVHEEVSDIGLFNDKIITTDSGGSNNANSGDIKIYEPSSVETTTFAVSDSVFATKTYVDAGIAAGVGGVDLSGYTTTADLTSSDLDLNGNKVLFGNVYSTLADLPSATTYHGMFAHVHATGKGYFAHAGNWVELANTSDLLTQSDIDTAVANLVDTAPDSLNTLNELAAALGDDANFASTVTNSLADKADITYVNSEIAGLSTTIANINVTGDITSALGSYSTTAQMNTAISTAVDGVLDTAPEALNTLNELAAALGDDANFASTMTTSLASKADISSLNSYLQSSNLGDSFSSTSSTTVDVSSYTPYDVEGSYDYVENSKGGAMSSDKVAILDFYNNGTFDTMYLYNRADGSYAGQWSASGSALSPALSGLDGNVFKGRFKMADDGFFIIGAPTAGGGIWYGRLDDVWLNSSTSVNAGTTGLGSVVAISDNVLAWRSNTSGGSKPDNGRIRVQPRSAGTHQTNAANNYTIDGPSAGDAIAMYMEAASTYLVYSFGSPVSKYVVISAADGSSVSEISNPGASNWGYGMNTDGTNVVVLSNDNIYVYTMAGSLVTSFAHNLGGLPEGVDVDGDAVVVTYGSTISQFSISSGTLVGTKILGGQSAMTSLVLNGTDLVTTTDLGVNYGYLTGTTSSTFDVDLSGYSTTIQMNTAITTAADAAEADAIATASSDATTKADAAQATAIATASSDATTKANAAEAAAIASASVTSTTKADAAQAAAIAAAATDATTKADAAQAAAIAAAATDATTKANAAQTAAETFATAAATTAVANVIDTAPDSLNTLNELAAALGDDADFASTVTTALAGKADSTTVSSVSTVANSALQPADAAGLSVDDADKLDGEHGTHYRINIYDINGTLVN